MNQRLADGLVAGTVAAVWSGIPSTVHALVTRRNVMDTVKAAGSIAVPNGSGGAQIVASPFVHAVVSLGWGVVLSFVLPRRRAVLWGAIAGLGIGALDLGVVARRKFPQIAALPQWPQYADHAAYGAVVGWVLERRAQRAR
jgi:hypothetical protein